MKVWCHAVECDFCFDKEPSQLYYVDVVGTPDSYTACQKCVDRKAWVVE